MKKRTGFETALVRRVAKKADYLRYATYEMGLEQLRRKRVARTSRSRLLLLRISPFNIGPQSYQQDLRRFLTMHWFEDNCIFLSGL